MFRKSVEVAAIALLLSATGGAEAAGDAASGKAIAERWCASCHVVGPEQATAMADVPSFGAIVERSKGELGWLEGFLADPHPMMPDMSLTRQEIRDLAAYIGSLD
ncbi:c-type cytochrome [Faunimonas sp. B44]|uniref:c-type cytochrome n=1 Tax=Faunimonas sp. B44 TaxID=3461493 RepID=UPI004043DD5A